MKAFLLSSVALALTAAPALAQSEADDRDVIVVETTRTQIDAFYYPGLTDVISAEDLDLQRPVDLDELLRGVPGVEVNGGPRRTGQTISLRGQGRSNTTLLVDGARQNYDSGHDGAIFVDPALLVGVETVRGPASSLYGSGASGGVVSFRTAGAYDLLGEGETRGFSLGAGYRSVDEESRFSATGYGVVDRFDFLGSISTRESGDIELGSGADLPADDSATSLLAKIGADFSDGIRGELTWQNLQGDVTEPNNGQGVAEVGALNALVDKDITTDNVSATLNASPASFSWMDLDITVYSNRTSVDEAELTSHRILRRDLDTSGIRADQRFTFKLGRYDAGLTVGGEYYEDSQNGYDSDDPNGTRGGAPDADSEFTAFWGQLELDGPAPFALPGRLILLPGIRYDEFETASASVGSTSNDATSPRIGLTYAPTERFNVFVNWAEAFRAPSINELYIDGTHFSFPHPILGAPTFISNEFIANPSLMPEETETVEFGVGIDLAGTVFSADQFELRASYYETDAENLIDLFVDFAFDPTCFAPPFFLPCSAGTTQSRNVSGAELSGFEAQLAFAKGPFSLDGSVSMIDGEDVATGDPLGSLAPTRFFLDGRYLFEQHRLVLGARVEYAGEFDEPVDPNQHRDSYAIADLYTRWQPMEAHGLFINAGVDNLFDEDYERVFAGVSEPARSVRLDLTWSKNF